MRYMWCNRSGASTAKRRLWPVNELNVAFLIACLMLCFEMAAAFMTPYTICSATRTRTTNKSVFETKGRARIRSKSSRSSKLFASATSEHSSSSVSRVNGETHDVIMTSSTAANDTVPYFMSLDEKEIASSVVSSSVEIVSSFRETEGNYAKTTKIGDEYGNLVHRMEHDSQQQASFPCIAISYDANDMVQADAMISGQLSAASSESEDYPALIKFLYKKDTNGQTVASKLFNFALLAISFSYVFFSVFNIDKGMTRGWTPGEISLRIPLDTWASYENSLSEKPVATKTIINVVIYLLGDWLSQTLFQGKNVLDFDAARTMKNGFIGMCFGPAVHEYYEFSDWILPVDGATFGITNRAFKILMDQTIYLSIKCSIYIVAIGVLNGDTMGSSTENVKNRLKPIMFTAWKFWPLVHCVTYGLIPARHRILWVNSVDLVWNAILASKARDDGGDEDDNSTKDASKTGLKSVDSNEPLDLTSIMKEVANEMEGRIPIKEVSVESEEQAFNLTSSSNLPTEGKH